MRIACLYLPGFAVQVERRADHALQGRPVIIGGYQHETGRVREVSDEASGCGVMPGMLLRQAYQLCAGGMFLPYREERYRESFAVVMAAAAQLCPLVEADSPVHILLGLRYERDERHFVAAVMAAIRESTGFDSSCGVASSRAAACIAAEDAEASHAVILEEESEGAFLRGLPLERLPLSDAVKRRLRLFGIRNAGDLLLLPRGALEAQFGKEGQSILAIVRGEDNREVEPWRGAHELVRSHDFATPVVYGSELIGATRRVLDSLCHGLQSQWQCCRCLSIMLILEDGAIRQEDLYIKEPSSSVEVLWRRLSFGLEKLMDVVPVEGFKLTASALCAEVGTQSSFLTRPVREPARFIEALGALQQRYGRDIVKRLVVRPGSKLPEERFAFVPCELEEEWPEKSSNSPC